MNLTYHSAAVQGYDVEYSFSSESMEIINLKVYRGVIEQPITFTQYLKIRSEILTHHLTGEP